MVNKFEVAVNSIFRTRCTKTSVQHLFYDSHRKRRYLKIKLFFVEIPEKNIVRHRKNKS